MARFQTRYENLVLTMEAPQGTRPGRFIQFQGGEYVTEDAAEIEFIRSHRWFGAQIVEITASDQRLIQQANVIYLECGYKDPKTGETCEYVAKGDTEEEAERKLNAHRTKRGHWPQEAANK